MRRELVRDVCRVKLVIQETGRTFSIDGLSSKSSRLSEKSGGGEKRPERTSGLRAVSRYVIAGSCETFFIRLHLKV